MKTDADIEMPKVTIVHAGRRDQYELAIAFHHAGLLESLVTDVFFTSATSMPARLANWLGLDPRLRSSPQLAGAMVRRSGSASVANLAERIFQRNAFINDQKGWALSRIAERVSRRKNSVILAYSHTNMTEVMKRRHQEGLSNVLFQMHPHPVLVREIYQEELRLNPQGQNSLKTELELQWCNQKIASESEAAHYANLIMVASTFTKQSLIYAGIDERKICIIPYGVGGSFTELYDRPVSTDGPLHIIFVGSLVQRKGLSYLLDATSRYSQKQLKVTLATRDFVDHTLLDSYRGDNLTVVRGMSDADLARYLRKCDLFVLPSLAEGFGHVILEAMASGLPALASKHTCAYDIVEHGVDGFVVPIRCVDGIVENIDWAMTNRQKLKEMGNNARLKAATYSWQRFRLNVVESYVKNFDRQ